MPRVPIEGSRFLVTGCSGFVGSHVVDELVAGGAEEVVVLEARSMYGASKIAGEYFLRAFCEINGLDYVVPRYMNVYGPRQDGGLKVSVLRREVIAFERSKAGSPRA